MFALSRGEAILVLFIFALVLSAGLLPPLGEALAERLHALRGRSLRKRG